jgi:hypothetical protein
MAHSISLVEYTTINFLNDDDKEGRKTLVDSAAVITSSLCCN